MADEHQFLGRGALPPAPSCRIFRRQPEAHVVNLSSIFGIIAPPGQTAYCAAKFAVRGFSESLRHESQAAGSPVRICVVHPGGVATNIARNSRNGSASVDNARRSEAIERFDKVATKSPTTAAIRIIEGIEKNEPAHPDRQRRALHGPAATLPPRDLLGADRPADRADARTRNNIQGEPVSRGLLRPFLHIERELCRADHRLRSGTARSRRPAENRCSSRTTPARSRIWRRAAGRNPFRSENSFPSAASAGDLRVLPEQIAFLDMRPHRRGGQTLESRTICRPASALAVIAPLKFGTPST